MSENRKFKLIKNIFWPDIKGSASTMEVAHIAARPYIDEQKLKIRKLLRIKNNK